MAKKPLYAVDGGAISQKPQKPLSADEGNAISKKESMGMSAMAGLGSKKKSEKKTHMHIEPTDNGGYITRHESRGGEEKMSEPDHAVHAHANLDALMKHVKSTYGAANTSEEDKQADESTPAPSPMSPGSPALPTA